MKYAVSSFCIVWLVLVSPCWSDETNQDAVEAASVDSTPVEDAPLLAQAAARPAVGAAPQPQGESLAERITRLRRVIEADEEHLAELRAERDDPQSEYAQAQAAFNKADEAFKEQEISLTELDNEDPAKESASVELDRRVKSRDLAKNRFDLAIEERTVAAEQIANLVRKLERTRQVLARLEGTDSVETPAPAGGESTPPDAASPPARPSQSEAAPAPAGEESTPADARSAPAPSPTSPSVLPGLPQTSSPLAQPATDAPSAPATTADAPVKGSRPVRKALIDAQEDARVKAEASKKAEDRAQSISEWLAGLDREIELEQKMLATVRKQRDNAMESRVELNRVFRERSLAGAPRAELNTLLDEVQRVEQRLEEVGETVRESSVRLESLQSSRAEVQARQINSMLQAEAAREQVRLAEARIQKLENPFSTYNVLAWLITHGPRMIVILLTMVVAYVFARFFTERVIHLIAHSGARGSRDEREARARTLVGVFQNAVSVAVFGGGGMMLLQEAGIPIAPLLGGAAVFGLAVAFGAQNLIRDYFYGFVILLENQYKINDVVQIGGLSGQVEKITLRMTVLRDLEGRVHFLPNGGITAVTNFTHGWSRALFEINVGFRENVDLVISVIMTLAREQRADPVFSPMILEDATMLGVDALTESGVLIKFFIKTRPLQQWNVKRDLLRRIKNRFDELGIEIAYPQRVLHYRGDAGSNSAASNPFAEMTAGQPLILQGTQTPR